MEREAIMRFYCFYCNHVSYSEAELNHHVEQHHRVQPFKCQLCDYRAAIKEYVEMHMKQMHSTSVEKRPSLNVCRNSKPASLPRALPRDSTTVGYTSGMLNARVAPLRTRNNMTRVNDERPMDGTVNASLLPKVEVELLAPLNEPIQHNRPLTVSFPEEGTIPPGCLVELVEVKTVNGTKELKLRLVPQQSYGSVAKDCRATTSQNTAMGKSAMFNSTPNGDKPVQNCTAHISTPQIYNPEKNLITTALYTNGTRLKKPSGEFLPPMKDERKEHFNQPFGIKEEVKVENFDSEKKSQNSISFPPVLSVSRMEQGEGNSLPSVCMDQGVLDAKLPLVLGTPKSSPLVIPSQKKQPKEVKTGHVSDTNNSGWNQSDDPLVNDFPGPKGFPVISAVFSLSNPQLLAGALRSIAVGNNMPSGTGEQGNAKNSLVLTSSKMTTVVNGPEHKVKTTKCLSAAHKSLKTAKACHQVETADEVDQCSTHTQSLTGNALELKKDKHSVTLKLQRKTVLNLNTSPPSVAKKGVMTRDTWIGQIDTGKASVLRCTANKRDISGKFSSSLKLSLKRIRVEVDNEKLSPQISSLQRCTPESNKQNKKRKRQASSWSNTFAHVLGTTGDMVFLCPTPLKEDQLVKQPGPNQPVVVLNHPKPQVIRGRVGMETITEDGPICHIMKMKLSKVMGQKYEVIGCTVASH
ncbi:uncharacterized protein LOC105029312 [Esox lucius]|uniref:C2H2-type domain-containing protein n=1 Tax=Esox lucius TaxID=8010 RepID=A0AAY5KR85_ESOLU|nr:uncharacterized protein LOC105029312 [Esox lucius]XP_012987390.1 uncharacterized protein LOC105029312 [Esox lucius]XP_012987391.1 uncharacterized protein LOC105029312 [Esox lucius]XP_012987392.1 uncharacterized protein LOC105029312 [Esox lucius]